MAWAAGNLNKKHVSSALPPPSQVKIPQERQSTFVCTLSFIVVLLTWWQNRHAFEPQQLMSYTGMLHGYAIHTLLLKEGYIIQKAANIPLQKIYYFP